MGSYYIIEKEESVVQAIRSVLDDCSYFNFKGRSSDYEEAFNSILKELPSLVFLCIDNTIDQPFEFAKELQRYSEECITIIAISNTKNQAYNVIKNDFFDYLLKPMSELDLRKTISKLKGEISSSPKLTVCLKSYKDYRYVNTDDILFLKADNNTTDFHMKDGNIIGAYKTLKTFEELLPDNFLRIHKSYVINSNYVSRINYGKSICTVNPQRFSIPFTKTYIENVEAINHMLAQNSILSLN